MTGGRGGGDAFDVVRHQSITPSPGADDSASPRGGAYSTAMIDRAIATPARDSAVTAVLRDRTLRRLLLVASVAQLLDAFTTAAGLHLGMYERNPFTVSVLQAYGSAGLLLQKVLVCCVLLAAMAKLPRRAATVTVSLVTVVTAAVVSANLLVLLTAR
jgi:hypothetical protein